ncbi:MAG TPA: hypothetical protein VFC51_05825 [Chloroflexota bacterium]|nr:hypothetical protein [Chloroflexota bacterium]
MQFVKQAPLRTLIALLVTATIALPNQSPLAAQIVVATVPVGFAPVGIAVNRVTNRIYVADENGADISVIDGSSNSVLPSIPLPGSPHYPAVNANTNRIYVDAVGDHQKCRELIANSAEPRAGQRMIAAPPSSGGGSW